MSTTRNRLQTTISNTPGTAGALTISTAQSGYRTFAAGDDGLSFNVLIIEGTAWEVRTGCVYTHSGTSLARGTLEDSSTGSAINLTSAAIVAVTATAGDGRLWNSAALVDQVVGTDANTTMTVNTLYVVDMSAWATADRTYTLPATAAVGDRVGIMISAGDASHELIVTAASGDTLNGVSGGTEWSRLFITNETIIMRCVVANATWIVEHDGRIPVVARAMSTGSGATTQSIATATWTTVDAALYTSEPYDNSSAMGSDGGGKLRFTARRAGQYVIGGGVLQNCNSDQKLIATGTGKNGAASPEVRFARMNTSVATGAYVCSGSWQMTLAADDYVLWYTYQDAGTSQTATDAIGSTYALVQEIL